ncbi:MAG: DUF5103 domain-containing protein [Bacteroidia bacterium]|nr:DUF5103 domain-containing protein [Bacteroidia bacterium]
MLLVISQFLHAKSSAIQSVFYQLPSIHTVRLTPSDSWKQQYIYDLDTNSNLDILLSFDELFADSRQLYFSLYHCDVNWLRDDMLSIEYWDGFEKQYDCSEYSLSFNTTVEYVHYSVRIPINRFKTSGNFVVNVYSIEDDELLLSRPIIIAEHGLGIASNVKKTNLDGTQELSLALSSTSSLSPEYLTENFVVGAWQNTDLSSFRTFTSPTAIRANGLSYTSPLVFSAGSEWRWADSRSLRGHVMSNTHVTMTDGYYNAYIPLTQLPLGYSYHEDFNGLQYIHSYDSPNTNYDITADYSIVNINFLFPQGLIGDYSKLYVVGDFVDAPFPTERTAISPEVQYIVSDGERLPVFKFTYFVKQSLANYRIVEVDDNGNINMENTESNFSETENDYHICAYYRDQSTGYYRLLAYKRHNTLKTPNAFIP